MILNIDTTTKNCSINIVYNNYSISLIEEMLDNFNHITKLHDFIKFALEGAKINISYLEAICINKGPGSYTGIRISSSAAKGLCYILNIPLIAIDSMSIMIQNINIKTEKNYLIMPTIISKNGNIYYAIFNKKKDMVTSIRKLFLNENIFAKKNDQKFYIIINNVDNIEKYNLFNTYIKNNCIDFIYLFHNKMSSFDMTNISGRYFKEKKFEDLKYFNPIYI